MHTGKLAFSPDGHTVASASYDNTVRFWEVATGRERRRYTGSGGTFTELAYAPDGCTVAAGSMDTTTVIFDTVGAKARQARTTPFSLADLATLWNDLASGDAHRAYEPLQVLAARPEQTLPFLSQQLQPFDPQRLDKIITDLDSDQFPIRDQATRELSNSAEQAEPALRRALTRQPSLELRRRAEGLLTQAEARAPRVTELLELIGSAEAQQMIEKLAQGQAEARLAQEAKDSLQRLKRIAALKTLHKKQ